jgi:mutual gliding-motility protein MglA
VSSVNLMAREVGAKIVFYGPGLSGKTTTLRKVYESVRPAHRGEMMSLATEGDRTLFFDFLPVKVEKVGDYTVRLALYTVPGQVFYNATRKLVLQGADGVVFVADSHPEAMDSNRESLQNLEENLLEHGIRIERFPLVVQYNKRDVPRAMPVEEMRAALNPRAVPDYETCATSGQGVLEGLKAITRLVIRDLRAKGIVPSLKASASAAAAPGFGPAAPPAGDMADLEGQIQQHLAREGPHPRPAASARPQAHGSLGPGPAPRVPGPLTGQRPLGPVSALASQDLLDYARAAEAAFAEGDTAACVRACREGVRRALAYAGEGSEREQAFLLRMDGPDLLRLQGLEARPHQRVDDGAFAMYVFMQALARLTATGLPAED